MSAVLFHGGHVIVGDGSTAEALLARDGRVAALGRASGIAHDAQDAERVDLRGGLMVPGWFDAHVHFMWWGFQLDQVDLRNCATPDEALEMIRRHAASLASGRWLVGGRFDKNRWGRWPTAKELDRATAGRPTVLRSKDGHSSWLNSAALRAAAITTATATPPGGAIFRDPSGAPTGILQETANELAQRVIPPPTDAECDAAILRAQAEALRRGVTGFEDLEQASAYAAFKRLHARGDLAMRVVMGIPHHALEPAAALLTQGAPPVGTGGAPFDFVAALANGMRTGDGDDWLRLGHLKIFADGALGSQTAALEEPYEGTDSRGILTIEPEVLSRDVARAAANGLAVAIHAIGDRAVHVALDAIAPTRSRATELRQRVEHVQLVREADLVRFAALGVIASMQPIHATSDRDLADRHWGPRRTPRAYPWRALLASGATLAFGSDAPVEPIDPLLGIHAAVARARPQDGLPWHPEQRLDLREALAAYSAGGAYGTGRERHFGTLAVGKRCDATVLDRDLFRLAPDELVGAKIRGTVVDGIVRFADGLC